MAKNPITVLDEGLEKLNNLNSSLKKTVENVLAINDAALQTGKNFFNVKSPQELNTSLKQNKTFVEQLNVELQERKRLEKALELQLVRNKLAESDLNKELIKQRFETQQLNKAAKESAILSSKLATEYQKQSLILTQLRRKYKDVALTQGESSKEAKSLLASITALDTRLKRVDASVGQFQRNVGNYPKGLKAATNAIRSFAGALGFTSGVVLAVNVMRDAFKTIKEYNSGLLNVSKTTGLVGKDLDRLSDDIISLSNKLSTVGTKSLLEYATVAGQLGVKGSENILAFAESLAKLETASDVTGQEGGANIARLLTLTDGGVQNVKAFSDELVNLGNNFAATENEILGNATAIAQNTGVYKLAREQALAFGVATKAVGIESEITGSTIGKTLGVIEKAVRTNEGLEQISRLTGIAQKDLGKAFKENSGKVLTDLIKGLNGVDKAGGSVNEQLEELGITAIRDQRVIGTLASAGYDTLARAMDSVTQSAGALDQEFETASSKLENQINRIGNAFDNFLLSFEDGKGPVGSFVNFIANQVVKNLGTLGFVLNENITTLEKFKILVSNLSLKIFFGESATEIIRNTNALKANAKEAEKLNTAYVKQFGSLGPLTKEQQKLNDVTEEYFNILSGFNENEGHIASDDEIKTIADLRAKIKDLKDEIEDSDKTDKEGIKTKQAKIAELQKELDAILGVNNATKSYIVAIKGSIAFMDQEIALLKEKQSKLATNSKEYIFYEKQIREAEKGVKDFKDEVALLLIELDGVNAGLKSTGDTASSIEAVMKRLQDVAKNGHPLEGFDYDKANEELQQFIDRENKKREEARKTAELRKELERQTTQNFIDAAHQSIEFVNTLFDAKIQRYEDDINRNNDYYAALLDNENLTEEQRSALEAERDRKNLELEKKKREQQRKAAIVNKAAAIAEVAINTAIAISKVTAQAGILAPALIPSIIALGAIQVATIAAQPIPQYEKGKGEYDNYEGMAIWGEKKQEAKISKDGTIELSPRKIGNHLTHVKKDDIIHPDASKFLSSLSDEELYNNLHKYSILASVNAQTDTINAYLMAQSVERGLDKQTKTIVSALKENRPKINLYNNNTISEDLKFLMRKNNTL